MSGSLKSDKSLTRFSTPVSELDDHRNQPSSLPRVDTSVNAHSRPGTRRGTAVSGTHEYRTNLLQVNEALRAQGMTTRDFENAVAEEESPAAHTAHTAHSRHESATSPMARKGTLRRPHESADRTIKSRASSVSSRSVSPPNSVEAFADPRRRGRAGTLESHHGSELELGLRRTVSNGTRSRRPTLSEMAGKDQDKASTHGHSSAEEDVCFPQPGETHKTFKIDFEELEDFVAKHVEKTPVGPPMPQTWGGNDDSSTPKVFGDLRPVPKITTETPNGTGSVVDDIDVVDEKYPQVSRIPNTRRGSFPEPTNRFTFFHNEQDDTIHSEQLGGLLMPDESFRDLFEQGPDGGVWWLDMLNPTGEEVHVMCKAFGVHPLTREDILFQESREKVELFKSYYFVCFRSFFQIDKSSDEYLDPVNVYAVVFREGLLTFTFKMSPHCANVRTRIGKLRDYMALSSDWMCYALIDDIVDSFGPVIRDIERETDAIEDSVFTARLEDSRTVLRSIGDCRKRVMTLLRLLGGKADVIKGFAKRCNEKYEVAPRGDVGLYLSDIQDHVVTMMSNLSHSEKMLGRCHSNYLAQISVDNITQGNQVNETLGKVTVIATILVPLNLICGLFGMNVPVPGMNSDSLGWFFGVLGVILGFTAFCLTVAKKLRFI